MIRRARPLAACLALLLLAAGPGCGTILGLGGYQEVQVVTNPAGAQLYLDRTATPIVSPASVAVDPAREHRVDARLRSYHGGTHLQRSVRIWLVLVDGLLTLGMGLPFDYYSGALYHFPERVVINLGDPSAPTRVELEEQFPPPAPGLPSGVDRAPESSKRPAPTR